MRTKSENEIPDAGLRASGAPGIAGGVAALGRRISDGRKVRERIREAA
jgi:hypothetical protein